MKLLNGMDYENIPNGTKVLVRVGFGEADFIGTIVGDNGDDCEDFGLHYYIVPEGGDRFEDELMFERENFTIIQ